MSKTEPVVVKTKWQVGSSVGAKRESAESRTSSEVEKTVATLLEVLEAGAVLETTVT